MPRTLTNMKKKKKTKQNDGAKLQLAKYKITIDY